MLNHPALRLIVAQQATPQSFTYTGGIATFTKPAAYPAVRFWVWGGGGGGGYNWYNSGTDFAKKGGGGGYMTGLIHGLPAGDVNLKVEVGQGGFRKSEPAAWPDGGPPATGVWYGYGGGGGGSSRVYLAVPGDPDTPLWFLVVEVVVGHLL